jgi:ubiquinol-cytochrome c reductase iron-sulfur subunit
VSDDTVARRDDDRRARRDDDDDETFRVLSQRVPADMPGNDAVIVASSVITVIAVGLFVVGLALDWFIEFQMAALAVAVLAFLAGFRRYFAASYPQVEAAERRPEIPVEVEPIREIMPMPRRRLLTRALVGAAGALGLAALVPVASLGPRYRLPETGWAEGIRLVTDQDEPIRPGDMPPGSVAVVWPEGSRRIEQASVLLLRLSAPAETPTQLDWVVEGDIVAYSKVCTHAGCPVGIYRESDNALYCPCHQAQFDVARGAVPTFGPASRPLPQLPLAVGEDGYLIAVGDFEQPVGPPRG